MLRCYGWLSNLSAIYRSDDTARQGLLIFHASFLAENWNQSRDFGQFFYKKMLLVIINKVNLNHCSVLWYAQSSVKNKTWIYFCFYGSNVYLTSPTIRRRWWILDNILKNKKMFRITFWLLSAMSVCVLLLWAEKSVNCVSWLCNFLLLLAFIKYTASRSWSNIVTLCIRYFPFHCQVQSPNPKFNI